MGGTIIDHVVPVETWALGRALASLDRSSRRLAALTEALSIISPADSDMSLKE